MQVIKLAEQFSKYPAGRYRSDGPYSGEEFRDSFLVPALSGGAPFVVDLDGARGYGSSFLEEAFGGLVRLGFSQNDIFRLMSLKVTDQSLDAEIREYISDAAGR